MKVLIGHFTTESNANIPLKNTIKNYELAFGDEVIARMKVKEVFERNNIEIIPIVYAGGGPSGVIEKNTFEYIESIFINCVKQHLHEIDGIYLWLHGASYVEEIGSGDHHIIKEIRKIVGPYLPIAVSCDPHGNLTKEYVESLQIIRSFRESPHTDMVETYQRVASMLCDLLNHRENIYPEYIKLPLILGGEQSVSTDEPVLSINKYMNELEKDDRIRSASWHVGYLRHDCAEAGCGVVVIPQRQEDQLYARQKCKELAEFVWNKRHEFHYTGITASLDDSIDMTINCDGKPFVLCDSGDNTTSGATGYNTYVLKQFLNINKKILFASICDPNTYSKLKDCSINEDINIELGMNIDDLSKPVNLYVRVISKGDVIRVANLGSNENTRMGDCVVLNIINTNIDIIITNHRQSYCHNIQFEKAGIKDWTDYNIVVVKQGYIFPELKKECHSYVMALTLGSTIQDTKNIKYRLISRPMYPIDEI